MLELKSLNKSFGKKQVLEDITFRFDTGVYGLLGPNGAGKTTLIRCITQLYPVKGSPIFCDGVAIEKSKDYLKHIGYLPQKFGMFKELKVDEMMQLMANLKGIGKKEARPIIEEAIERVNLSDRIHSKVGTLSGGMVRRLGVAQALLGNPDLLIFDEPTAGLDPEERLRFKNIISEIKKDKTIIISTHIVEDVEAVCDHVAVMKDKRIAVSGTCREIEKMAAGKVYVMPETESSHTHGQVFIQKHFEQDGVRMIKLLTNHPQPLQNAKPNVEDGYICILKGI